MRKIDLHIHTLATESDNAFNFSLDKLVDYVRRSKLDAIAITNHNIFRKDQFAEIHDAVGIPVFPGIEINLENGHLLLIADFDDLASFEVGANLIEAKIANPTDHISVDDLGEIFGDLNKYLLIPHYDKKPSISAGTLQKLSPYIFSGEVSSPKKFVSNFKDSSKLTPVLFSDERMSDSLDEFPTRQTYIDCGEITLSAVKTCLKERKVALSEASGNALFEIFDDGQKLSTGLNVLLGERSSGKTYTLNRINRIAGRVKYIRQFSLLQQDDATSEKTFREDVSRKRDLFRENYLGDFKAVLNDVITIDLYQNDKQVEAYLDTLLKSASESERKDAYSKARLFDESEFRIIEDEGLIALIDSIETILENTTYKEIVEKHVEREKLRKLICELIEIFRKKHQKRKRQELVNSIVKDVKNQLGVRTAATQVNEVDLYKYKLDRSKVARFAEIVSLLREDAIVSEDRIEDYRVVARKGRYSGAGEIKDVSGKRIAFSDSYGMYNDPYLYLQSLKQKEAMGPSELYKLFAKIDYKILNSDGFEVSGGERSEFRLIQEIYNAQSFDILLIDEPESSFDNIFLKNKVNNLIRAIAENMPVVVVTHNSTVGASVGADYLLYAKKEPSGSGVRYRIYSGYPTDKVLRSPLGNEMSNFEATVNSLEAGVAAYEDRKVKYENIRD